MTSDPAPLAILSAAALLAAGVMVATVRGEITAERYTIACCEQELACLERRARSVRVDLVAAFARWNPATGGRRSDGGSRSQPPRAETPQTHRDLDWSSPGTLFMTDASDAGWAP